MKKTFLLLFVMSLFCCGKKDKEVSRENINENDLPYLSCQWTGEKDNEAGCVVKKKNGELISSVSEWKIEAVWQENTFDIGDFRDPGTESLWQIIFEVPDDLKIHSFLVNGNLIVNGSFQTLTSCPIGYVRVPADGYYKKTDFCVMKYEASKSNDDRENPDLISKPNQEILTNITAALAKYSCIKSGKSFRLINNHEWLAVATDIATNPQNWSENLVGSGQLNIGNSDKATTMALQAGKDNDPCLGTMNSFCADKSHPDFTQKRTHSLSNGEIIWDLSGNAIELLNEGIDFTYRKISPPDVPPDELLEFDVLKSTEFFTLDKIHPTNSSHSFWNDSWGSKQGIGTYRNSMGYFLYRGGSYLAKSGKESEIGIFSMRFENYQSRLNQGFRCVYLPNF